jgi:hypothetical protein
LSFPDSLSFIYFKQKKKKKMSHIPSEIGQKIFTQLSLADRLECTLVCRHWWRILDGCCLFYSIEIKTSNNLFSRFMEMIEKFPDYANQVEELLIVGSLWSLVNRRRFCDLFPNMRSIQLLWNDRYVKYRTYFEGPMVTRRSTSKVKHISDSVYCEYASQMLSSNLCSQLSTLCLNFCDTSISCATIVHQLKDMPVLQELHLQTARLSVANMEMIHHRLPSVKKLGLLDIYTLSSKTPLDIIPTTSIKEISVSFYETNEYQSLCQWYQYMTDKYTNVTKWDLPRTYVWYAIEDEQIEQVYENGFLEFLKLVGPKQEELTFDRVPDTINVFQLLDDSGSRIKKFTFTHCDSFTIQYELLESGQAKHVQEIHLEDTALSEYADLQGLISLTTLELGYSAYSSFNKINITRLFNGLPDTLKELYIDDGCLAFMDAKVRPTCIEIMHIRTHFISDDDVNQMLSYCPKLVELFVTGRIGHNKKPTIMLQNPSLRYTGLSIEGPSQFRVVLTCPNQTEPACYLFNDGNATCVSYQDFQDVRTLFLESSTEKRLNFSGQFFQVC